MKNESKKKMTGIGPLLLVGPNTHTKMTTVVVI